MPSAAARAPSSSGAVEAPVHTLIRNRSPAAFDSLIRPASAWGTAFGYPAPVNPLMPTVSPGRMALAASSAGTTLRARSAFPIRPVLGMTTSSVPRRHDAPVSPERYDGRTGFVGRPAGRCTMQATPRRSGSRVERRRPAHPTSTPTGDDMAIATTTPPTGETVKTYEPLSDE